MGFAGDLLVTSGSGGGQGRSAGASALDLGAPGKEPPRNSDGKSSIPTLEDVRTLERKAMAPAAMGAPLGLSEELCFATIAGEVVLTDLAGRKLWSEKLGGTCHAPPVAADGVLVVGCDDGKVYGFREKGR
jgi:outer membrane protein assembly factor BamB